MYFRGVFRTLTSIYDGALFETVNNFQPSTTFFFESNQGQASAFKVTETFKVFEAQSCLMVA